MAEIIFTPSAAARRFAELGKPKSEGWIRYAAVNGKLKCITTSTGRRLFRERDIREFIAKAEEPRPAA